MRRGRPLYAGHAQPHVPGELGYYDLTDPDAREAQAALARAHGIDAFCYYHYWFGGRRLLERPLDAVLASGRPDFPFCVCWANENWTRRWDGLDHDDPDGAALLRGRTRARSSSPCFRRSATAATCASTAVRCCWSTASPTFRMSLATVAIWRDACRAAGIGEIHLAAVQRHVQDDPTALGFDAAVEFPPIGHAAENVTARMPESRPRVPRQRVRVRQPRRRLPAAPAPRVRAVPRRDADVGQHRAPAERRHDRRRRDAGALRHLARARAAADPAASPRGCPTRVRQRLERVGRRQPPGTRCPPRPSLPRGGTHGARARVHARPGAAFVRRRRARDERGGRGRHDRRRTRARSGTRGGRPRSRHDLGRDARVQPRPLPRAGARLAGGADAPAGRARRGRRRFDRRQRGGDPCVRAQRAVRGDARAPGQCRGTRGAQPRHGARARRGRGADELGRRLRAGAAVATRRRARRRARARVLRGGRSSTTTTGRRTRPTRANSPLACARSRRRRT